VFARILLTALVAGGIAGLFAAAVHQVRIVPLIERAEVYENAPSEPAHPGEAHPGPGHAGVERVVYTVAADILVGIGYALLLGGAMALAGLAGHPIDAGRGMLWGAAGFAAFTLMPALGLAPSLPGMQEAELAQRQAWWLGTAAATALGLAALVFGRTYVARLLGLGVLVLPHLLGPPAPAEYGGTAPPELAAQFAVASLAAAGMFWLLLGGLSGWLHRRLQPGEAAPP
jgi:cobalt transporter subunit CbtA